MKKLGYTILFFTMMVCLSFTTTVQAQATSPPSNGGNSDTRTQYVVVNKWQAGAFTFARAVSFQQLGEIQGQVVRETLIPGLGNLILIQPADARMPLILCLEEIP